MRAAAFIDHVTIKVADYEASRAFYQRALAPAAIAAGGVDNGAPGVRAKYHPNYYGAFVFDPEGNNVEAVCHEAPQ